MNEFILYHYTRNFPENIEKEGLKVLDWDQYRIEIYKNIPDQFKKSFDFLKENECSLDLIQNEIRIGRIHLTTVDNNDSPLKSYFGGEYLRRVIESNYSHQKNDLFEILKSIGYPLRIKVSIPESLIGSNNLVKLNQIRQNTFAGGNDTDIYLENSISSNFISKIEIVK